jgi:hypothetical protein
VKYSPTFATLCGFSFLSQTFIATVLAKFRLGKVRLGTKHALFVDKLAASYTFSHFLFFDGISQLILSFLMSRFLPFITVDLCVSYSTLGPIYLWELIFFFLRFTLLLSLNYHILVALYRRNGYQFWLMLLASANNIEKMHNQEWMPARFSLSICTDNLFTR